MATAASKTLDQEAADGTDHAEEHGRSTPRRSFPARTLLVVIAAIATLLNIGTESFLSRPFIDFDDLTYVGALEGVSLHEYFTSYLWKKDSLSFPVRDLSFFFDYFVSNNTGIRSFLLTQLVLFLGYLTGVFILARRSTDGPLAILIVAVVALHPLNLEITQWVISRKHLLAALFCLWAVTITLDLNDEERPRSNLPWLLLFTAYLASLLSHPVTLFLPIWVGYFLWPHRRRYRARLEIFLMVSFCAACLWTAFTTIQNRDYAVTLGQAREPAERFGLYLTHTLLGIGRATWQLIVPIEQAIYFNINDASNFIGLGIFVCFMSCAYALHVRSRSAPRSKADSKPHFFLLAALLFLPQLGFSIKREDFVMADRFLFLCLPYLLLGIGTWIRSHRPALLGVRASCLLVLLVVTVGSTLTLRSAGLWSSDLSLFRHCVEVSGSDRCWWHYNNKALEHGCATLMQNANRLHDEIARASKRRFSIFLADGSLAVAYCEATADNVPFATKLQGIDRLAHVGSPAEPLTFARNLLSIEAGDPAEALRRIVHLFLGPNVNTHLMSQSTVGVVLGQLTVLCEIPSLRRLGCADAKATYEARYEHNVIPNKSLEFGAWATRRHLGSR